MIAKSRKFKTLLSIFVLLFLSVLLFSNWKINKRRVFFQTKIESLKQEIEKLKKEKEKNEIKISEIDEEEYLKKILKEDFDYKEKGETVTAFILPEDNAETLQKENFEMGRSISEKSKIFLEKTLKIFQKSVAGLVEWLNATFPR